MNLRAVLLTELGRLVKQLTDTNDAFDGIDAEYEALCADYAAVCV